MVRNQAKMHYLIYEWPPRKSYIPLNHTYETGSKSVAEDYRQVLSKVVELLHFASKFDNLSFLPNLTKERVLYLYRKP